MPQSSSFSLALNRLREGGGGGSSVLLPGAVAYWDVNSVFESSAADFVAANSESLSIASNADVTMEGNKDYWIHAIVKADAMDDTHPIVSRWQDKEYSLLFAGTELRLYVRDSSDSYDSYIAWPGLSTSTWYRVLAGYDHANQTLFLKVDDNPVRTKLLSGGVRTGSGDLVVGGGGFQSLLLDYYPTAALAISLRQVRSAYLGPAIRVRRSSDNAEQDIGFVDGWLDTESLLAFVGAGDGFVKTWYDQSVNANHLIQNTAGYQPYIVQSGVVSQVEGIMGVYTDGDKNMSTANPAVGATHNSLYVVQRPEFNTGKMVFAYTAGSTGVKMIAEDAVHTNVRYFYTDGVVSTNNASQGTRADSIFNLKAFRLDFNAKLEVRSNTAPVTVAQSGFVSTVSGTLEPFTILRRLDVVELSEGWMSELVFFNTDEWANAADIESKIHPAWNLFGAPPDAWASEAPAFLDTYTGAYSAYSLRIVRQGYTGPLIRVRRATDWQEKDIYALSDGNLDTARLLAFAGSDTAYVTTWYDQTGNNIHATQTVNIAYQPAIVIAGVLQQEDGRVAVKFDGSNDYLRFAIPNDIRTAHEIFMVCKNTGDGTPYDSYFGTKSAGYNNVLWHQSDSVPKALGITQPTQNLGNNTTPNPNWKILNAYADSLHNFTFRDLETAASVSIALTNTALNFSNMHIGASANHVTFDADWMPLAVYEMIVYTTNKPADRDDMAAAINTALGVY